MATDSVEVQLTKILDEYNEDVQKAVDESAEKAAKEAVNFLKANSPKRSGAYARDWAVKKDGKTHTYTVHNRKHYQLTHLLENGHLLISFGQIRGRVPAQKHIAPAEEMASELFINEAERHIENV